MIQNYDKDFEPVDLQASEPLKAETSMLDAIEEQDSIAEGFSKFNSVLGEPAARIVEYDTSRLKQEHIAVKELELALQFHEHEQPGMTRYAAVRIQRFCRNMLQR